jgi:cell division protein FtsB
MRRADRPSLGFLRRGAVRRGRIRLALTFVSLALLLNALVGERGLIETLRARTQNRTLASSIATLRAENDRLREIARRLKEDPATIEDLARRELGLVRPGEILVVVRPGSKGFD